MDTPAPTQKASKSAVDATDELALLTAAVREAGAIALKYFGNRPAMKTKYDGTPVSEADLAVDNALRETLTAARPEYGWLSEESEDDRSRLVRRRVWIVDPIDGTRAFLKEKAEWTIAAALVEDGRPIAAAVYNPATDEFFEAAKDTGARLNGTRISVTGTADLEKSHLIVSQGLFRHRIWDRAWPEIETRWVNSVAYRLALVAAGKCDGTLSMSKKHDWDLAAAELLVQEAGGRATTHSGDGFSYNTASAEQRSVVAAGPVLHQALLERTRAAKV